MEADARRYFSVMKACFPTVKVAAAQHGFTLVELLVGVALGSLVLASLGGALLVSEVKVSANIQRNLDAKDDANRAIDLMRAEARLSSYLRGPVKEAYDAADYCNDAPIAYIQRSGPTGKSIICYKTVFVDPNNPSPDLPGIYRDAFAGKCVLVRKGLPYMPNGELDGSADPIVQVFLAGKANPCSFSVALASSAEPGVTSYSRNADIQIALDSKSAYSFSAKVPSNPAYDGNDFFGSGYGCMSKEEDEGHGNCSALQLTTDGGSIAHRKERSGSLTGSSYMENLFYFDNPSTEYSFSRTSGSGFCTYESCYVKGGGSAVQLTNVDALIFTDKEIRPR